MNRTSLSIRNNRKVLNTDKPELLSPPSVNKPWNSSTKLNAHENSSISLKSQNQEKKTKAIQSPIESTSKWLITYAMIIIISSYTDTTIQMFNEMLNGIIACHI